MILVRYDPVFGARPLKRTIQREVETPIAQGILGGTFSEGMSILVDAREGDVKLTISAVPSPAELATLSSAKVPGDLNILQ
jgi:ATP-dependent Clp protease ATP-binding subunit ClpA